MPMDRFAVQSYKSSRLRDLTGRLRERKLQDEDRSWMADMRTRTKDQWTKEDEDRARRIEREQTTEGRQSTLYAQGQESYQHGMLRRPKLEQAQDEISSLNRRHLSESVRQAELGPRPIMNTGYNPETGDYEQQLVDPYSGETKPVKGGLRPVQARRLYDISSAEVSAWKASNFDAVSGQQNDDYVPLDDWVIGMRQRLGGPGGLSGGGLKRPGTNSGPQTTTQKSSQTKKKVIPGLFN